MSDRFDEALLGKLVCPVSRGPLLYDADGSELISEKAGLAFPIRAGIAIMVIEEARLLKPRVQAPS